MEFLLHGFGLMWVLMFFSLHSIGSREDGGKQHILVGKSFRLKYQVAPYVTLQLIPFP